MTQPDWHNKIIHHAQLGGIETAVADNGAARGTRIAWMNTGTGLRYKVVIDRAMDIADAFYNRYSLAWLGHGGITAPAPFVGKGVGWLRTFGGGLVTTCGLSHVGGPDADEYGERGLHGLISNTPAEIIAIRQPDPVAGSLEMSITGLMRESTTFGPNLELKRTISGTLGQPVIRIRDEVSNRGNTPAPHMLLYHLNFGWPLVDEGAGILWEGEWKARDKASSEIFRQGHNFRKCMAPMDAHAGTGEAAAFINVTADAAGRCVCGICNERIGVGVIARFSKAQLPWLTNWQHWGKGEYVMGLEPGTHPPIGQVAARKEGTLIHIAPGETRVYDLELEVLETPEKIVKFLSGIA